VPSVPGRVPGQTRVTVLLVSSVIVALNKYSRSMDRPTRKKPRHHLMSTAAGEEGPATRKRTRGAADAPNRAVTSRTKEEEPVRAETEKEKAMRERAMAKLREATDLPTSYAALKLVKDNLHRGTKLTKQDEKLLRQASLAVPFLMYKQCVELFTRPRNFQGLAFSIAKAELIAKKLFESIGPACCSETVTEAELVNACGIEKVDAHKVLPKLRQIGQEARAKVEEIRKELEKEKTLVSI